MATTGKKGSRRPQYLVDNDRLAGKPEEWVDNFDGGSPLGLHDNTLYDENESQSGALYDEATGKEFKNDRNMPSGLIHRQVRVKEVPDAEHVDVLGELYDHDDEVDTLLNKPGEELTQADIDAMVQVLEEQKSSRQRHPSSHKPH